LAYFLTQFNQKSGKPRKESKQKNFYGKGANEKNEEDSELQNDHKTQKGLQAREYEERRRRGKKKNFFTRLLWPDSANVGSF